MHLNSNPADAVPTLINIPTRIHFTSEQRQTLQALLVRLVADVPLGTLKSEEQEVVALVEIREF